MLKWLKTFALKTAINELDELEPLLANLIRKGQDNATKIDPDFFAKEAVDIIQKKACSIFGLDPAVVLK